MKRISKAPEVRRQELLDTAMELFAQKGYEETSMGDIARAAGVAQGLCYRYFDSKQKLFQEALASDRKSQYSAFYHAPGNQDLHEELSLQLCRYLLPHVTEELRAACASGELTLRSPETAASFLLYGQIGLMGEGPLPLEERLTEIRRYADLILAAG